MIHAGRGWSRCAGAATLAVILIGLGAAGCAARRGAVAARTAAPAAPADTASFTVRLERFLAGDEESRASARRSVAPARREWRDFEAVVASRRARRDRSYLFRGEPADRRQIGYGLVRARANLQAVTAADPADAESWVALARTSAVVGDPAAARVQLEHALAAARAPGAAPADPALLREIARERAWVRRDLALWEEGLAAADEGLAAHPGDWDLRLARGLLLAGAGRFAEAMAAAAALPAAQVRVGWGPQAKALRTVPSDYGSQWIRSQAYAARGDPAMAFHMLGQDPDDAERATYLEGGTQDRKLGTDTRMPRQVRFWNDVGLIAELLGADAATDYYTRAWSVGDYARYFPCGPAANGPLVLGIPDGRCPHFASFFGRHWVAGSRFGFVAAQMDRMALATGDAARREAAAAASACLDVLERRGARPAVCRALRGRIHYRLERWEAARHDLARARAAFADSGLVDARTSLLLGMLELRDERFAAAADLLTETLDADPGQALAWRMLGVACANCERLDEAIAAMDRAVALEPLSLAGRYNRGLLRLQLRRCREAVADLDFALRLDPANPDLARLLQLAAGCGREQPEEAETLHAGGVGAVAFEADTGRLIAQLAADLEGFFALPDSLRPRCEAQLARLDGAADAGDAAALRATRAVLLGALDRPAAVRDLLAAAWPDGLRPPEDLVLLLADRRLGDQERIEALVEDALAGRLRSTNPYLWVLALLEVRERPQRWGGDAEVRLLARWHDQPSSLSGTTIRYWSEVMTRELVLARGE